MSVNFVSPERVLIVDDHALVRDGLRTVFEQAFPACAVLEAADLPEAIEQLAPKGESGEETDLVLLDLLIPGIEGLSGLETLRARFPTTPVVIVSGLSDPRIVRGALAAGAAGFIPKSLKRNDLLAALGEVLEGGIYRPDLILGNEHAAEDASIRARIDSLTPQQRVVLGRLTAGRLNKQIAHELDVSMTTVKAHVSAILQKMHVFSRTQAVILANRINFRG